VKQLNTSNAYWTPSTPNFANIDAAIALNKTLYCIQYTVSASHTFNCHTFVVDFLEELSPEFRRSHSKVVVVFVVPSDVTFCKVIIPKSQQSLASAVTCGDGIELAFRKARSAAKGAENEDKMEEEKEPEANDNAVDEKNDMDDDDDDEHDTDENSVNVDSFWDDDCGEEEGFDEEEMSPVQKKPLCVHFLWESLADEVNMEKAPLSFLKK
jgi:midasin (ATPase involved in ribosome maturation)